MNVHLLYPDRNFDPEAPACPSSEQLVADLHLEVLVGAMAEGDPLIGRICRAVLLQPLSEPRIIGYRQAILEDFTAHPELLDRLIKTAGDALAARRGAWGWGYSPFGNRRGLLSGAVRYLAMYLDHLKELRAVAEDHQGTVRSEGLITLLAGIEADLDDEYLAAVRVHLRRLELREGVWMAAQLAEGNASEGHTLVVSDRRHRTWTKYLHSGGPESYRFSIDPHDDGSGQALEELGARALNRVANAAAQSADHITRYFSRLQAELAFYRGCLNLHRRLDQLRGPLCVPLTAPAGTAKLTCTGVWEPCLALTESLPVDGHDLEGDGRSLVIITGANSGGKTTLLRSIGVAQLMMQAGMFVCAETFEATTVSGLFSHFVRPEDPTMNRGRLEEELARMSAIAHQLEPGGLILFNESFHSTNEREGSEIAAEIVEAVRDSESRAVCVTHQYDFARRFLAEADTTVLFLRAEPPAETPPRYRIVSAPPLPEAFGRELYSAIFADRPT